jgi:type IV pilus assembly protein PilA
MKKLLNKKGFTLMEMLIVVAIIVILVSISIPVFSGSLDSAKQATDAANLRAAKAAYITQTLAGATDTLPTPTGEQKLYYDLAEGKFVAGSEADAKKNCGECTNHADNYITVNGGKVEWSDGTYKDKCTN